MLDRALWLDLIGLPFKHRGRGPDAYDCYGLVLEIYRRQGIIIFDTGYPTDQGEQAKLIEGHLYRWKKVPQGPGVVLLFRQGALGQHVGMQIDHDRFIHATESYNQVKIDRLSVGAPVPQNLVIGAYQYAAHD